VSSNAISVVHVGGFGEYGEMSLFTLSSKKGGFCLGYPFVFAVFRRTRQYAFTDQDLHTKAKQRCVMGIGM